MNKIEEKSAVVKIYSTSNNTIVHVVDVAGNTIAKVSGGMITKHDRLKADPTIAMFIAKKIKDMIKDYDIKRLYVQIRGRTGSPGPGPSASSVIKTLGKEGLKIVSITDLTRIPRGGPKKKGGRRGRRV